MRKKEIRDATYYHVKIVLGMLLIAIFSLSIIRSSSAETYNEWFNYPESSLPYRFNNNLPTFEFRQAVRDMADRWNAYAVDTDPIFVQESNGDFPLYLNNVNDQVGMLTRWTGAVYFGIDPGVMFKGLGYAGETNREFGYKSDVAYNGDISWTLIKDPFDLTTYFPGVVLHEFGHTIGLDHQFNENSVMNYGHPVEIDDHLFPMDVKYLHDKFPARFKNVHDLGIWTHFRPVPVFTTDPQSPEEVSYSSTSLNRRVAQSGDSIVLDEIWYGNYSQDAIAGVKINVYLSIDDIWDSADIELASISLPTISSFDYLPYYNLSFSLPTNIASGSYQILCVILDGDNVQDPITYNNVATNVWMGLEIRNSILSNLAINGINSVYENSNSAYTATASWSDGTTSNVTPIWTLSSYTYASINASGVLTANSVTSNQSVTVNASYAANGVTKTASQQVTIVNTTKTLTALSISGSSSVNENDSANYSSIASWSDGSTSSVAATWSENSSYASISSNGVLATSSVTGNQSATVSASYTSDGVTKSATLAVSIIDSGTGSSTLAVALDESTLVWTSDGDAPWFEQSTTKYYGTSSAQSGIILDNQKSYLKAKVIGPGTVSYWWRVSSEANADTLTFYIVSDPNSTAGKKAEISGTVGWQQKSFDITVFGNQYLKWAYWKDGSVSSGSDAGWVDYVTYTPAVLTSVVINGPDSVNEGSSGNYSATSTLSNGMTVDITPTWSINSTAATIDSSGVLTPGIITSNQAVTITATVTRKGVTLSATKTVTINNIKMLTGIAINGSTKVDEKSSAQFSATALYDDGTTAPVTPAWSVNTPAIASISGTGLLTAGKVTANQTVTITGSYTEGSITKTATYQVIITDIGKDLTGIAINGAAAVNENSFSTYTATAQFDDGTSAAVNPSWSLTSPYATINSSGILSATTVSADQMITLGASYTYNSSTQTASLQITVKSYKLILTISPSGSVSSGQGVTITSDKGGVSCTWNGTATSGTCVSSGISHASPVVLTATLPVGTTISWGVGCDSMTGTACTIYGLTANKTISPITSVTPIRTLTVASTSPSSGVAITVSPNDNNGAGNDTTPFTRMYNDGISVTLTAPATAGGNNFNSWSGCTSPSGTTCYVTMDADKTVTANFTANSVVNGACGSSNGGTFTTTPSTNLCSAGTASTVGGTGPWTWTCQGLNGGTNANCTANIQTWMVAATAGAGGTISPSSRTVNHGSTTTFTVTPNSGYTASVSSTCGGSLSGTTYTTSLVTANCTVSATFATIADTTPPVLTNVGHSNVTSTGAVINWTTDEAATSEISYKTAADANWTFTTADTAMVTTHSMIITDLTPSTAYVYQVTSKDAAGNPGTSEIKQFTTLSTWMPSPAATVISIVTDTTWKAASSAPAGWETSGFDDSAWGSPSLPSNCWGPATNQIPGTTGIYVWGPGGLGHAYIRKTFTLTQIPAMATLYAFADDDYIVYINGTQAASSSDGGATYPAQQFDITNYLASGTNVIAIDAYDTAGGCAGALAELKLEPAPINVALFSTGFHATWTDGDTSTISPNGLSVSTSPMPSATWVTPVSVQSVKIFAGCNDSEKMSGTIKYFDGTAWNDLATFSNVGCGTVVTFPETTVQGIQIVMTSGGGGDSVISISEVQILGKADVPAISGLSAYYKFDEATGTVAHDSIGTHHGTLLNGASFSGSTGAIKSAVSYDGIDDYVRIPYFNTYGTDGGTTICAWAKVGSKNALSILGGYASSSNRWHLTLGKINATQIGVTAYSQDGAGASNYSITATVNDANGWNHVCYDSNANYSPEKIKVYVNGSYVGTVTTGVTLPRNDGSGYYNVQVINSAGPIDYFDGSVDELVIYNRSLSASEIAQLASIVESDTTAPEVGMVTAANYQYGTFVDATFDLSAVISDNESNASACEYCASSDGICDTEWMPATLTALSDTMWKCEKTGITGFANGTNLSFNIRAANDSGMGIGTAKNVTVDAVAPSYSWSSPVTSSDYKDGMAISIDVIITDVGSGMSNGANCNPKINGGTASFTGSVAYSSVTGKCSGTLNLNVSVKLSDGAHSITLDVSDNVGNHSLSTTRNITIDNTAPVTTATPAGGTYYSTQTVTLAANDATATIYYTTDGSSPTTSSAVYSGPITISTATTLKYFATDALGNTETIKTATYTIVILPDGDLDGNGVVSATDALKAIRIAAVIMPASSYLSHGDVAPLVNGKPQPDGKINIGDVVVILRKAVGLESW